MGDAFIFRKSLLFFAATATLASAVDANAATLDVGPSQAYATPCAAVAAAQAGDEIDIAVGTYTDSCEINTANLTLKGVGGQPKIDLSGTNHPADYKGIYVISADNVTIENLELTGAHIDDSEGGNAAGLRVTGHGLVVHGCYIHDNQNGILAAPVVDGGTMTVEYTELSHNGLGDGCDQGGCVHNIYVSKATDSSNNVTRFDKTIFQFNWSHDLASDTANKGHLLKSRSRETDVLYNRITDETGHASYEVDIPNGGLAIVVGNVIEKGTTPDNPTLLNFGEEGFDAGQATTLYVVNNTFVNDYTGGVFISVAAGGSLTAHNNLFSGPGTVSSTGALSGDNLSAMNFAFVDPSAYDYHLASGSPAIGKAVNPGSAGSFSLIPTFEYVQPLLSTARATANDCGAFEFATSTADAGQDSTVSTGDTGVSASDSAVSTVDSGLASDAADAKVPTNDTAINGDAIAATDGGESTEATSKGGCGCDLGARSGVGNSAFVAAVVGLFGLLRQRSRKRQSV